MRLFTPSNRRMSRLMVATLLVLTTFFLLYFFVYVQRRAEYLHEKAFRVLNQASVNLNAKYQTLITNARREVSYRAAMKDDEADYKKLSLDSLGRSFTLVETVGKASPRVRFERKWIMPLQAKYNQDLEFTDVKLLVPEARRRELTRKLTRPSDLGRVEFYPVQGAVQSVSLRADLDTLPGKYVQFRDTVRVLEVDKSVLKLGNALRISFRIELTKFMRDAIAGQEDLFDGYQLFRDQAVAFTTVPGGMEIAAGDTAISAILSPGTTTKSGKPAYSHTTSRVLDVEIAGKAYKLFLQRVQVGQIKEGLALGLLMSYGNYRDHIYEIPTSTILLCSLVMLVLMLGYPFIKLALIGNGERLKTEDAFFCTFSVVISSFLVTLIALSYYVYKVPEDQVNQKQLRELAGNIKHEFIGELRSIREQFASYRQVQPFKELQDIMEHVGATSVLSEPRSPAYPEKYRYFDLVFWIDKDGNPFEQFHTGKVLQPYVNVKDRAYFKGVIEERLWNLDATGMLPEPFTLQPIFNRITGENMAVVAAPFHEKADTLGDQGRVAPRDFRPVLAADVKMHSVIRPVMPLGYGFCIMDREGLIWFHSDQRKNLQEYFLKECGNSSELLAALQGNKSQSLQLTYNGQYYSAYGTPLPQMPLYLVVFHQASYFNGIRTLSTSIAIVHYLLALLPLCLLLLVHKATFYYDARLRGENFAFRWLTPKHGKEAQYRQIGLLLVVLIGLEGIMLFNYRNERDLWAFYALAISTSFAVARTLLYNDLNLSAPRQGIFWGAYLLTAGMLVFFILRQWLPAASDGPWLNVQAAGSQGNLFNLVGSLVLTLVVLVGLGALFVRLRLRAFEWFQHRDQEATGREARAGTASRDLYPRLLCVWVGLLSIMPALAFYRANYLREHRMAAGHQLVQAARDLTDRRQRVQAQYREIVVNTPRVATQLVQEHGRYVEAVNRAAVKFDTVTDRSGNPFDNRFSGLLEQLRPLYNRVAAENSQLLTADVSGNHWRWKSDLRVDSLQLQFFEYNLAAPRQYYLTLAATIPAYARDYLFRDQEEWRIVLLGLMAVGIIAGLMALIRYTVRHLFNFGIHETTRCPYFPVPKTVKKTWEEVLANKQRVLLTGAGLPDRKFLKGYFFGPNPEGKAALQKIALIDLVEVTDGKALLPGWPLKESPPVAAGAPARPGEDLARFTAPLPAGARAETAAPVTASLLLNTQAVAEATAVAPPHLIITHFEQLAGWAANQKEFGAQARHLCQLIEDARAVLILSVRDPNDLKEKVEELIGQAGEEGPAAEDAEKEAGIRAERQSRLLELLRWQNLIGTFEARYFSLEAFRKEGKAEEKKKGPDPQREQAQDCAAQAARTDNQVRRAPTTEGLPDNPGRGTPDPVEHPAGAVHPAAPDATHQPGSTTRPAAPNNPSGGEATAAQAARQAGANGNGVGSGKWNEWLRRRRAAIRRVFADAEACRQARWSSLVVSECHGHGPFLRSIEPDIRKIVETYTGSPAGQHGPGPVPGEDKRRGDIILKIQERARFHYNALWESCTREEQYILYDLAQDGLVDCRNMQSLRALLQKGLISYDGSVKLMNRSFRNYILHAIEPRHGSEIEAEIRQKSSWSEYRAVLALVIGAVITFIFLTQRETYNQIHAVITTLTASIPLILNLIGTMSFGGSKSGSH